MIHHCILYRRTIRSWGKTEDIQVHKQWTQASNKKTETYLKVHFTSTLLYISVTVMRCCWGFIWVCLLMISSICLPEYRHAAYLSSCCISMWFFGVLVVVLHLIFITCFFFFLNALFNEISCSSPCDDSCNVMWDSSARLFCIEDIFLVLDKTDC